LRGTRWLGLALLTAALPALAADDPPKDNPKSSPPASRIFAPLADKPKYQPVRELVGKIVKLEEKELGLEVVVGLGKYAKKETVDLTLAEDARVRTLVTPTKIDENGRVKRLTPDELRKHRGPDLKLPGYTAEMNDLHKDLPVQVTLSRLRDTGPRRPSGKAAADEPLFVTVVVILADDRAAAAKPGGKP
jgi:hypothetical protein